MLYRVWFGNYHSLYQQETLRTALAMGADRAIHVEINGQDYESLQPLSVSKMIAAITQQEKVDVVLVGKQVGGYAH